jgi:predicted AAA+ superfamily ATPase
MQREVEKQPYQDFTFKGRFVENYVLQQFAHCSDGEVHYWAERADREIDIPLYLAERYSKCLQVDLV